MALDRTNCEMVLMSHKYKGQFITKLNEVIIDILKKRKLTFGQFTNLLLRCVEYNPTFLSFRNGLIQSIFGTSKLTYRKFEFIMTKILNEPIPDDDYIKTAKNMGRGKDLRRLNVGRLTVIEPIGKSSDGHLLWLCDCRCGNRCVKYSNDITKSNSDTISCGCYSREISRSNMIAYLKKVNKYNNYTKNPLYFIWKYMLYRCYNENDKDYKNYGGRGITVCDRWKNSLMNFYEDMGDRPEGMSIDRIDVNGNYEPGNCKWSTLKEQANNKRNTLYFDDGENFSEWLSANNFNRHKAWYWFKKGFQQNEIASLM